MKQARKIKQAFIRKKKPLLLDSFDVRPPLLVETTVLWLQKNALRVPGLFRVSGAGREVTALKARLLHLQEKERARGHRTQREREQVGEDELDNGGGSVCGIPSTADPHTVASVLKAWLLEIPEPLLTLQLYDAFITAVKQKAEKTRQQSIRRCIELLPPGNRAVLSRLMNLCVQVSHCSQHNQMGPTNLAIVFAPTLLRSPSLDLSCLLEDSGYANTLIALFITDYERLLLPFLKPDLEQHHPLRSPAQVYLESDEVEKFKEMEQRLLADNGRLLTALCSVISQENGSSTASALLNVFSWNPPQAYQLMKWAVDYEMQSCETRAMLFRGQHVSSLLVRDYIFIAGHSFLLHSVGPVVRAICRSKKKKAVSYDLAKATTAAQQKKLFEHICHLSGSLLRSIAQNCSSVPLMVLEVLQLIADGAAKHFPEHAQHHIVLGVFFLRFLCPSIVAPEAHHLLSTSPSEDQRKGLVLCARVLQKIANDTENLDTLGELAPMRDFVHNERKSMPSLCHTLLNRRDRQKALKTPMHGGFENRPPNQRIYHLRLYHLLLRHEEAIDDFFKKAESASGSTSWPSRRFASTVEPNDEDDLKMSHHRSVYVPPHIQEQLKAVEAAEMRIPRKREFKLTSGEETKAQLLAQLQKVVSRDSLESEE